MNGNTIFEYFIMKMVCTPNFSMSVPKVVFVLGGPGAGKGEILFPNDTY